jgi:hypothetical protein
VAIESTLSNNATRSVVVVRPSGWEKALAKWIDYRASQYKAIEIDSIESPYDLRQRILNAVRNADQPVAAILLCGDVANLNYTEKGAMVINRLTPTFELPTRIKLGPYTTPTLASDAFYGDVDDDECPEIAVGRLPAKDSVDLERMLQRSIDYERSSSFGPWRDRIHTTAGVGGFGLLADTAIETVTRRILSEGIPDRFQLQMTYASITSPYCPSPHKLSSTFIRELNQGGLFWVYIGHGNVNRLDDFVVGDREFPICSAENVPQIAIPEGAPVAIMLACFTGAFDAKVDCFAELLLAKNDGPIAVIAGSRVTMPYGMSQLASELMDECFQNKTDTLGNIVLNAKRQIWKQAESAELKPTTQGSQRIRERQREWIATMAAALSPEGHSLHEERKEHARLMNLLGDPLLQISYPKELTLECKDEFAAEETFLLQGSSPIAGKLRVELALSRDRLPDGIRPIDSYEDNITKQDQMDRNYGLASNLVVTTCEQKVAPGKFSLSVVIPVDCRGRCVVKAFVYGTNDWATASKRIKIQRKK